MVTEGSVAPDFELPSQDGSTRRLSDLRGKWVLVYFYPKDDTAGCTKEACMMRDALPDFSELKAVSLGISADSVESHAKFAKKYDLNFPILSDPDRTVISAYGVWGNKKFMGREYEGVLRTSFLVDPEGIVKKVYEGVKPPDHAQEVITDLKHFQSQ